MCVCVCVCVCVCLCVCVCVFVVCVCVLSDPVLDCVSVPPVAKDNVRLFVVVY